MTVSRRHFLGGIGATAGALSLSQSLGMMAASGADFSGYRALVMVMLKGGQDSYDLVLPVDQPSHDRLVEIRTSLFGDVNSTWRARDRLLELTPDNAADFGSRAFGLPEHMSGLHALFQNGQAALVPNVGPLRRPVDRTDFDTNKSALPDKLFSHNDQQSTWMSGAAEGSRFGWGGRIADVAVDGNANSNPIFTAVSVAGNDVFLAGQTASAFQLSASGPSQLNEVAGNTFLGSASLPGVIDDHLRKIGFNRGNLFETDFGRIMSRSLDANAALVGTIPATAPFTTTFPSSSLGQQLQMVARMIAERSALGLQRQVFYVSTGGYDTHANQNATLVGLQTDLSASIASFYAAIAEIGAQNDTVLFTGSDFGRTLTVNGDGTDHGWGGHHFVVGGAVNGRRIIGNMPLYDFNHPLDSGRGRLIPGQSVDQYASTFARWFGLNDSERRSAISNISSFNEEFLGFL
jgi:uncharacterized protein (DUF1501 family)